jgi:hypothetical protein
MHPTGFLPLLEMPCSLSCIDFHSNIVSVNHSSYNGKQHKHMRHSTVSARSHLNDSEAPASSKQHHNSLVRSKERSCSEMRHKIFK